MRAGPLGVKGTPIPDDAEPGMGRKVKWRSGLRSSCVPGMQSLMPRGQDRIVRGWRPLTVILHGLEKLGQRQSQESPAEKEGGQGRGARASGFYSVTVDRGVIGIWESCSG